MLKYKDSLDLIYETEKAITLAESFEDNHEQQELAKHLRNLLKAYIREHRLAAEREGQYAMR